MIMISVVYISAEAGTALFRKMVLEIKDHICTLAYIFIVEMFLGTTCTFTWPCHAGFLNP